MSRWRCRQPYRGDRNHGVASRHLAQDLASRWLRRRPVARAISRNFSWRAWGVGVAAAGFIGVLLYWATPFKPIPALLMGVVAGGSGTLGGFVMMALKRDAGVKTWGNRDSVTGAVGLLDTNNDCTLRNTAEHF